MGLFDEIDNEVIGAQTANNTTKTNTTSTGKGLFDDIDNEILNKQEPTFKDSHPILASTPEAFKQLGLRAVKSYPDFAKGVNDLIALTGDKTHIQGLSNFGRSNAEFWQDASDKIVIDDKYRGLNGLKNKETVLPTVMGEIGGQATNLLMAAGGGAAGGVAAKAAGLGKIGTGAATIAGTAIPNLAQEGQYLDKIEAFKNIYGRIPTPEELAQIQNVAIGEKAVNTALETVSDKLLFGKLFPQGTASKGVKNILKNAGEQALTEAGTEGMQESVSIGAEKLLGINQGNNLERLGEAMAIGGITGGAIGGGATAISQPYDTQIKAPEAIQNVSAKIVDGGKVLYDSATEALSNAGNAINNTLNAPDAFDTLTQLRNSGALSPSQVSAEEIAPNIAKKKAIKQTKKNVKAERIINDSDNSSVQDTGLPNLMKENETLQNLTQEGESQIVDNETVNNTAKEIQATDQKAAASQAVLEKPKTRAEQKQAATKQAIEKIKELAPNIAAKKEEKTNAQKAADLSKLQREVGVGGLIKDNEGNVYEVLDNGYIRNVDTNEHSAGSVDREYQKYEHNEKELINATPFKYNPKSKDNADNYTFSKQEAVDAYNNYIKNPTEANREIYEDTIGRLQNEYYKLEPQFKAELEQTKNKVSDSVKEIAPNIAAKVEAQKEKSNKEIITDYINSKPTQEELENYVGKNNVEKIAPNIVEKQKKNKKKRQKKSQEKTSQNKEFDVSIIEKLKNHTATLDESNAAALHYLKLRNNPDSIETAKNLRKLLDENRIYNENNHKKNNGGTLDGHSTEKTNGDRSTAPEKQETGRTETKRISQEEPANGSNSDEVRRGNDISNDGQRGISQKDKEIIEKNYKNQHELNKAIEDYINNEEYKKYPGSIRMPQAIKDWLKKYTGAGGLEKQGAEGKGLLSEFYTPQNIVNKMWDLAAQYVNIDGAKVLEPSVGVGRFLENSNYGENFDVIEMNPVSAKITKILYPNANVTTGVFQEKFINKENNTPVKNVTPEYDIVIGNPPYGQYSGRYKGLGEGKLFSRIETYFISRGLDTLKENGVMVFIVPSSFLDGAITQGKNEIGKKCELLDAYRLPENTFDTTAIGTDIIVLRKTANKSADPNLNLGRWFENNPNKILGETDTRKNRFGKEETFVKGDKNAVEQIDTSKTDIKETKATEPTVIKKAPTEKKEISKTVKKTEPKKIKGKIEYTEYVPENKATEREIELWEHTAVDGSIQGGGYTMENGEKVRYFRPGEDISQYKGELYNDFNYLQGDIYEKLDQLEKEDISEKQKDIQRKKLQNVLPEPKTVMEISFNPTSDFIREFNSGITKEKEHYDWNTRSTQKVIEEQPLDSLYLDYVSNLSRSERGDMTYNNIYDFIKGNKIRIDYRYPSGCYGDKERAEFRKQKSAEVLSKLKNVVDKTFNEFIKTELTREQQEKLAKEWNRQFNAVYNPDYTKMPMIVKGLNSEFYGNKLELQNVQIEGVNFLTNKGVGLLGFEVGVGKTLTGIISTVQNMQMGRCRKPLILVPKQVKDNWIREINQAFPNIEVNDVGNLSKFKGEIPENTLTVATYEALGNIWYEDSIESLTNKIYSVQNDFSRESTKRGQEKTKETAEKMLGEAEKGNKKLFTIQQLGFDHITVDEAHNFKNLFDKAKADGQEGNTYANIIGGSQSTRAARLFLLAQHILNENHNRNVFMLTATPFNNSPIEVFNMVSFIGKDKLDRMGLYNVYQFMENYADISSDWIVNSNNEVEYKQIVTGFKNASSLRELIKSVMLIRSAEDAGIVRPEKFTKRVILEPSEAQLDLIAKAEEEATTGRKDDGAILKAINQSRQATLSPDIATGNLEVSPENFVKNSPKIHYVMEAVEAMKKKDGSTSQIIYMPLGVKFLPKMRDYLVNKGVFKADEVAIIDSGVADDKISKITDSFNDKDGKIKLVIGTNKIKEGMNLNKNSSVLYVPYMDWNPTDFVQVVGRIWRRGNRYSKIRVVVPLLKNSSDSFMFQKLNEKTDRINNIMDESKEYIDTSELNTAEEKINMISNPDKKVRMFIRVEEQKLQGKKNSLEGRLEMVQSYKNKLESDEHSVKSYEQYLKDAQETLEKYDNSGVDKEAWEYRRCKERIDNYKKELYSARSSLKRTKNKIVSLELDFEGKDSTEAIQAEIEKVAKEIEDVKNAGDKKLVEYQAAYEEERKNKKSIKELVAEFDRDTDSLYGTNAKAEESKPLGIEPKKNYEKTAEKSYNVPKIEFETASQKAKKKKAKSMTEKAKEVIDAKKYNAELKRGVAKWSAEINSRRYDADRTLNSFINHTKSIAKELGIKDKHLREVMPFLRERTDFPESLNRAELKAAWDKIHSTKGMAERITKLADNLAEKFDRFYQEYKAVQADGDFETNESNIKNYVPHDWQIANKKQKSLLTNYFATKSRFAKQRTIDTWYKGIEGIETENGEIVKFIPKTLDYAELFKIQSDNLIKATVDKVFADSVKTFKADNGASLVMAANKAPSDWIEINNSALNKATARPVHTEYGEKISPDLQNKLAEIGIAIGSRLPKYKANGVPNSLGRFVKNEPPEIRLQKWFSLKTLAHEVGHACDMVLGLTKDGFVNRHKDELIELNKERIEAFTKQGDKDYATKDSELIAELFGVLFNDIQFALQVAPGATSEVLGKMSENKKLETLLPGNFDWGNAKHILEEKVVEIFKMPVKVHPDIAATLKTVFENKREYLDIMGFKPGEVLDKSNALAKQFNFSLSGFHGWALSESFFGNVGVIEGAKQALNFKKIYNSVKNNDYDIYKKDAIAKQAIDDGLQIGATLDVQRDTAEGLINNTIKLLENKMPGLGNIASIPVKAVSKSTEINNKVLWDCLHNNYKLGAYEILTNSEYEKNGSLSNAQRREIAQWVNDSFGGQVWENLGINPTVKKAASRWLMSPDWLLSTTRQFMGFFSSERLHKALNKKAENSEVWQNIKDITTLLGINSITDDVQASGTRGRIARAFWARSVVMSVIYMNVLNALFRMWDREKNKDLYPDKMSAADYSMLTNSIGNRLYVFIGRNSDGTERYLRLGKQFREIPEMVADPIKHFGAKTAPIPQSVVTAFTGRSMGGYENKEISKAEGWARIGLAAKNLGKTYLPFSVSSAMVKKGDYSLFDLIGNTSKGMTKYKAKNEYQKMWGHSKLPQSVTDALRLNEEEVTRSMRMNRISEKDIKSTRKSARTAFTKPYKEQYKAALNSGDSNKIIQITDKMQKNKISPIEQRKIYLKALSEFYKERGLGQ